MNKIVIFFALTLYAFYANAELPSTITDALKKAGIPQNSVAIFVQSMDSNVPTITLNADKSMNPASVMKLITTQAALDLLTPAYRWKTEVYRDGALLNGVLEGDLIIKGYGDPSFGAAEFWRLLISLRQANIKEIKGDLVIDKTYFAKNIGNHGSYTTFDNETWRAYNAQPSAFLVNGRNTSFKFMAAQSAVNISQEFELPEVQIINNMKLSTTPCDTWRDGISYNVKASATNAVVTFKGNFSTDCGEKYLELSLFDDEKYAFFMFKKLWRELGGTFSGNLRIQTSMSSLTVKILEQLSEPLGSVVRDINKWSNNLMARQLLLTVAAEKEGVPATELYGATAVKTWLVSKNLNFNELVIENGSGLSRIERISAEHLGQLLLSVYKSPVMPEFMASLPILSLDGTIQKRLKNTTVSGRAHLKTGSIEGVSAIAGYVLDAQDHLHVVVMFINHAKAGANKSAQDALIQWVGQQS